MSTTADSIVAPPIPLQTVVPAYPYTQYADDANIVAFFYAYNVLSQQYLDWFNNTPMALYTSPNITGPLLDWVLTGIYGIARPVFSTLATTYIANAVDELPINTLAINQAYSVSSGSAVVANDDYYKRTATWFLWMGDGRAFNFMVLRKRVARFLYGQNGSDVELSYAQNVSIEVGSNPNDITITIPPGTSSSYFEEAINTGVLTLPFQLVPTVVIT